MSFDDSNASEDRTRERAWGVSANIERALPAGEGREVVHPDGSLTRVEHGAVSTLGAGDPPVAEDGSDGVVRLEAGALWHEADPASPAGQRFDVHLPAIRVMTKDGTFAAIVERDGSSFVTAIAGDVAVVGDDDVAVHIAPLDAALMSPEGLIIDAILATPEELAGDPWIGRNLRLSGLDAGNMRLPSADTPRFEPRPHPGAGPAAAVVFDEPAVEEAPVEEAPVDEPVVDEAVVDAGAVDAAVVDEPAVEIAEPLRVSADEAGAAVAGAAATEVVAPKSPTYSWDWGTSTTTAAAAGAAVAEPEVDEEAAPEVVAPTEVLEGDDRAAATEDIQLEEEEQPASPARALVAALLVLLGLIIVVVAIRGLLHSESPSNVTPAGATTTAPSGTDSTAASGGSTSTTASSGSTASTAKGGATTTTASTIRAGAARYTVHPTRCAQSGNQLTAEGTITNQDTVAHSYRIRVIFTTDGTNQAATASADVTKAQPNKAAPWTMSTTYSGDLSKSGGCRVGSVDILS